MERKRVHAAARPLIDALFKKCREIVRLIG
jgi:hypothetical protein